MIATKQDILGLKAGEVLKVKVDTYSELRSLRTRTCEAKDWDEKPQDIERYSCSIERDTRVVTITAIPKSL